MKFATKVIRAGSEPEPVTGAIVPPIYMTSTFDQRAVENWSRSYAYTRANNPNFTILEAKMAALEDANYATVFSSGQGCLTALISTLSSGDKVLALGGVYGGTFRLFNEIFKRYGIEFHLVNPTSKKELNDAFAIKPKWLFFETPTNPLLEIFDIKACVAVAKKHGALTIIDNTFATPYCQNPLKYGADVVWHSSTKYLGGHSDVMGGVAMTNNPKIKEMLDFSRKAMGVNPSPFDCWLIMRGIKTLAVRMAQHMKNAGAIAKFLQGHPLVKKVYYPGLKSHKNHSIATKQMRGYGGMVSVEFDLPIKKTMKLISSFKLFTFGESLGGVQSLVSHPVSMTHTAFSPEQRRKIGIADGLVRLSVGIEDVDDLIEDLKSGLEKFSKKRAKSK